jgi:hypothetical protein
MEKIKKEDKERIMEKIRKAGSEEYVTEWTKEGKIGEQKQKSKIKKGRTSKASGARFELKVRKDLQEKGRIVDKWTNNVDLEENKLVIAKRKYNPFSRAMTIGTGFPDFVSIKHVNNELYSVIGVEVKINGMLSKIEKQKCAWYLQNKIFSQIWIAKAVKKTRKIEIEYDDFSEKYGEKYNKT